MPEHFLFLIKKSIPMLFNYSARHTPSRTGRHCKAVYPSPEGTTQNQTTVAQYSILQKPNGVLYHRRKTPQSEWWPDASAALAHRPSPFRLLIGLSVVALMALGLLHMKPTNSVFQRPEIRTKRGRKSPKDGRCSKRLKHTTEDRRPDDHTRCHYRLLHDCTPVYLGALAVAVRVNSNCIHHFRLYAACMEK